MVIWSSPESHLEGPFSFDGFGSTFPGFQATCQACRFSGQEVQSCIPAHAHPMPSVSLTPVLTDMKLRAPGGRGDQVPTITLRSVLIRTTDEQCFYHKRQDPAHLPREGGKPASSWLGKGDCGSDVRSADSRGSHVSTRLCQHACGPQHACGARPAWEN